MEQEPGSPVTRHVREGNSSTDGIFPGSKISPSIVNSSNVKKANVFGFHANWQNRSAHSPEFMKSAKEKFMWELNDRNLKCSVAGDDCGSSSNTVVSVERRQGTNILIIGCGPGGRLLTFIEFDTKKQTQEWEEAICKCIGKEYTPPRGFRREGTEVKREKKKVTKTVSAPPDVQLPVSKRKVRETHLAASPKKEGNTEVGKSEELVRSESLSSSSSTSSTAHTLMSTSSSTDFSDFSSPGSLRSDTWSCSSMLESDPSDGRYTKDELMETTLVDYNGLVYVKSTKSESRLHVGDCIQAIDAHSNPMDARTMSEYIRTTECGKFTLRVSHGVRCAISIQERAFRIDVKDSEMVQVDAQELVSKVCNMGCSTSQGQISKLAVTTGAGNILVGNDVLKEKLEVQDILQETTGFARIHLQPECVLRALSELEGISIDQGVETDEVVDDSEHRGSDDNVIDASKSCEVPQQKAYVDVATVDSESDSSRSGAQNRDSSSVEGQFAGLQEDNSSCSSADSAEVTLRNHSNRPHSAHHGHRKSKRFGRVFPKQTPE